MRDLTTGDGRTLADMMAIRPERAAAIREEIGRETGVLSDPTHYFFNALWWVNYRAATRAEAQYAALFAGYLYGIADMTIATVEGCEAPPVMVDLLVTG